MRIQVFNLRECKFVIVSEESTDDLISFSIIGESDRAAVQECYFVWLAVSLR